METKTVRLDVSGARWQDHDDVLEAARLEVVEDRRLEDWQVCDARWEAGEDGDREAVLVTVHEDDDEQCPRHGCARARCDADHAGGWEVV